MPSIDVTITAPPKLVEYLDDLIAEQGFGASRGEVARTLVWQRIHDLISEGIIDRRRATAISGFLVAAGICACRRDRAEARSQHAIFVWALVGGQTCRREAGRCSGGTSLTCF